MEARDIKDMESWISKMVDKNDVTDAFVDVKLGNSNLAKTAIIDNNLNPVWNETFKVEVCHKADFLLFDVKDKDHAQAEQVGLVEISTQMLLNGQRIEDWFPIRKKNEVNGHLHLGILYQSMAMIGKTFDVPSYFPMHRGCNVVLYQDAHCPSDVPHLNMVRGPNDRPNHPQSCWKDLYYFIEGAQQICCLTGWAIWTKLQLFRGEEAQSIYNGTLGDLLIKKANEGVKIQVMVWSEKSSGAIVGQDGVMNTHDMETYYFFKNNTNYTTPNKVLCALTPRELCGKKELSDMYANEFNSAMYTHHQKSVIVDAPCPFQPDGRRKLVAFVGGLDLNGGRYDNPYHELYSTLKTDHKDDFRNSNHKATDPDVGPREPWHDIHCRVDGPIAMDVLQNFVERWKRQASKEGDPPVVDERYVNPYAVSFHDDPSMEWNVQLFRSITNDSAVLNEHRRKDLVLTSKKGRIVDMSITTAYIQMIRNAENFIYIENQYFMGSAYSWDKDNRTNCNHTIPAEITKKIIDKIQKGERFTAYVVIPMFPEGDPASTPIQAILYWQYRTMEMMYKDIGEALQLHRPPPHLGNHPTDWLLFMCPGKREMPGPHLDVLTPPEPGSQSEKFRDSLRFMIYVHSKMMIVDDSYIIVGSANINERSMSGTRDTEMAVGCWQPQYSQFNPYGDVHMFRMSLWAEHLCIFDDIFKFPGTLDCVSKIKEMVWYNWQSFNFEKYNLPREVATPGQLLMYPVEIQQNGTLSNLPRFTSFPDFPEAAKIFGTKSAVLPEKITT